MKSAVVTVVGRPSSGKSTLVNALCGRKVAIVGSAPQTTRNAVRGIVTEARGQLVLLDTPGFHLSDKKLNLRLKSVVTDALPEVDAVLYVADSTRPPGDEEERLCELISGRSVRVVVAITKCDLHASSEERVREVLSARLTGARICRVSAQSGEGLDELRASLFELAPEGEPMYPEEFYTDQPPEFRAAELIREQAINRVREELPHALYVEIEDMEERDDGKRLWIRASIVVERESQKGILIGRGGSMIREIRIASQRELNKIFSHQVSLDLRVKVQPGWRHDDRLLKKLIY